VPDGHHLAQPTLRSISRVLLTRRLTTSPRSGGNRVPDRGPRRLPSVRVDRRLVAAAPGRRLRAVGCLPLARLRMSNHCSSRRHPAALTTGRDGPTGGPLAQKAMVHVRPAAASKPHPGAGPAPRGLPPERSSGLLSWPACQPVGQRHQPYASGAGTYPHPWRTPAPVARNERCPCPAGRVEVQPRRPAQGPGGTPSSVPAHGTAVTPE